MKASNLFEDGPSLHLKLKATRAAAQPPRPPLDPLRTGSPSPDGDGTQKGSPPSDEVLTTDGGEAPAMKRRKVIGRPQKCHRVPRCMTMTTVGWYASSSLESWGRHLLGFIARSQLCGHPPASL